MKYIVEDTKLTAIADAIREKSSSTDAMTLDEMAENITRISGGGDIEYEYITVAEGAQTITTTLNRVTEIYGTYQFDIGEIYMFDFIKRLHIFYVCNDIAHGYGGSEPTP